MNESKQFKRLCYHRTQLERQQGLSLGLDGAEM